MNKTMLIFSCLFLVRPTCACGVSLYTGNMQDATELPADLDTAHEVILTQSAFICELSVQREQLKKELEEVRAAFAKLLAGNRREKFIHPDQKLLEFPDDPALQSALEAARREAEQEIEQITYTRTKKKREAKPRSDSFPDICVARK